MVELRESTIIDAPIDAVWRVLRDFNGHERWHPAIAASEIEHGDPVDAVGSVRHFRLADGSELREQLLSLSDRDFRLSYCLLEAPLPLMGYVATIALKPVTDGDATFWEWRCSFQPPAHRRAELVQLVRDGIYRAGFVALRRLLQRDPLASETDARPKTVRPRVAGAAIVSPSPQALDPEAAASGSAHRTRAVVVEAYGGPEVLRLRDIALPPLAPREVRLRHTAIGVNFIDVYCRRGDFDLMSLPGVPGMEAAGIVEAVGADVADIAVGDRVAYACAPVGAYAERRNMSPGLLVHLSDDIDDDLAAAGLLKGVTASFLLHDVFAVRQGHVVLIHAAAGGVGQLLVQWAHHLGAIVVAAVSTSDKARIAERLGADHVVIYSQGDFAAAVLRITDGRGADVVYDAVGKDSVAGSLTALATRGHLVSFGQASGPVGDLDIGRFSSKSITVSRPNYAHYADTPDKLAPHVQRFFAALRRGALVVAAPRRYPLAQAAEAHRDLESRRTTGSLVLTA